MQHCIFLLFLFLVISLASAAKAKARYGEYAMNQQQLPDNAPQGDEVFMQQQQQQQYPQQQYQAPNVNEQYTMQSQSAPYMVQNPNLMQRYVQQPPQPNQGVPQQASFLATQQQPQADAGGPDVLNALTQAVQQQAQALTALKQEQQQLARFEKEYSQRTLELFEKLAATPKCEDITDPGKVEDQDSCESACKAKDSTKYDDGNFYADTWWLWERWPFSLSGYKCECLGTDGNGDTDLCNNNGAMRVMTAFLGMAVLLIHL
jgi:hypothetical protein